ncbi:MAG: carboxypeptidase-like regulatory domain-containing protein [Pseudomonadota bacterium]
MATTLDRDGAETGRMPRRALLRLLVVVLLPFLLHACGFEMDAAGLAGPTLVQEPKSCQKDSDCMEGLVCDPTVRICVSPDSSDMEISIRLVPPAEGSNVLEEQYAGLDLGESNTFRFVISRPIRVLGTVTDASGGAVHDYKIVARSDGEIAGLDYYETSEAVALNEFTQDFLGGEGFELYLKPDKIYNIFVHPTSGDPQAFPLFHARRSFNVGGEPEHPYTMKWEIRLPDPSEYLRISGRVVLSESFPEPVSGAKVFARAPVTGETSTTAYTDEDGWFEILVQPPEADDMGLLKAPAYEVHVRPSDANPVVPQVVAAEGMIFSEDQDLGLLEVGYMGSPSSVTLAVQDPSGLFLAERLGDTVVRISGEIGKGTVVVEDVVNGTGVVSFGLPPGDYVISVMPPADGDLALLQQPLSVAADRPEVTSSLRLDHRPELSGWVLSPDGSPVPGAEVIAIFTGKGAYPTTSPLPERRFITTTDDEGAYLLRLDPGQYRIIADPPVVLGLPRRIEHYVFVTSSEQRTIWLDYPVVVSGTVEAYPPIDEQGQVKPAKSADAAGGSGNPPTITPTTPLPAPDVKVEIYLHDPDADPDEALPPLAEGFTDDSGSYLLILPAVE